MRWPRFQKQVATPRFTHPKHELAFSSQIMLKKGSPLHVCQHVLPEPFLEHCIGPACLQRRLLDVGESLEQVPLHDSRWLGGGW